MTYMAPTSVALMFFLTIPKSTIGPPLETRYTVATPATSLVGLVSAGILRDAT